MSTELSGSFFGWRLKQNSRVDLWTSGVETEMQCRPSLGDIDFRGFDVKSLHTANIDRRVAATTKFDRRGR